MKTQTMLHRLSTCVKGRICPEAKYLFFQKCGYVCLATEDSSNSDLSMLKKQKRPRKHLGPILRSELGVSKSAMLKFFRDGGLESLDRNSLLSRLSFLQNLGFNQEDINLDLSILLLPSNIVTVRKMILEECGVAPITTTMLIKYDDFSRRRVSLLKASGCIAPDVNVPERVLSYADADVSPPNYSHLPNTRPLPSTTTVACDAWPLSDLHRFAIRHYLVWYFDSESLYKNWRLPSLKSFRSMLEVFDTLQTVVGLTKDQLQHNQFLVQCEPEQLLGLLNSYPVIGGKDIKEIIRKQPRVALCTASEVKDVLKTLEENGLKEEAVSFCPTILTVDVSELRQRLTFLKGLPDLWSLRHSPHVVRMLCQKNLIPRLQYLKSLGRGTIPTALLLTSSNSVMKRSLHLHSSRTSIREFLEFLAAEFNKDVKTVRDAISRHPLWRYGSASKVSCTLTLLRSRGFSDHIIFEELPILLYPRPYVQRVLDQIKQQCPLATTSSVPVRGLRDLALCLYYMEKEHTFSGLGVFEGYDTLPTISPKLIGITDACGGETCRLDCKTNPFCSIRLKSLNKATN